ncbi:MAG: hypothetical protein ACPGTQ_05085 [Colwellia sp.]
MKTMTKTFLFILSITTMNFANAEQYIFPNNGQSDEQQQKDENTCHSWAVDETGFDPTVVQPPESTTTSEPATSEPAKQGRKRGGALRGAAVGALIAEIGGNDVSNGAAKGAAVGVVSKRRHNKKAAAQEQAAQQEAQLQAEQAQQIEQEQLTNYNKARNVCLEAKGYSISD